MNIYKKKLFHLVHCRSISHRSIEKLLTFIPQLSELYQLSYQTLQQVLQIDSKKMSQFIKEFESIDIDQLHRLYESKGISYIIKEDKNYPAILKETYNPPHLIFTMGDQSLLTTHNIACVGARDADDYAYTALGLLLPPLIKNDFTIVSGLAKGTDTIAHRRTIEFNGKTIAVIGGGFFHIYPQENVHLATRIVQEHLLISEYPPIWRPEKWHFPMRNRIISGISKGTIVIQAKKRSGSLITADFALEEGREVFALPGPIDNPLSEGTNHLIQQGAKLISSSKDILEEFQKYKKVKTI